METHTDPTDPTTTTPGFCGCGCGEPVARRYRPGHDAKHHSTLAAALTDVSWSKRARAADLLAELGWTSYADRAALRAVPYRAAGGRALQVVAEVAIWQVSPSGQHHCDRRCRALTAEARAAGALGRVSRLARDSWLEFVPNTPELSARLVSSWDQCTECATDTDRLEAAERFEVAATSLFAPTEPKPLKKSPTTWQVASDVEGLPPVVVFWNHTTNVVSRAPGLLAPG